MADYRVVIATPKPSPVESVMQLKVKVAPRFIGSLASNAETLAYNHCQGLLRAPFLEESFDTADYVLVAMDSALKQVHGFAVARVEDDALEIPVLCAKRVSPETRMGTHLLNLLTVLAQKLRKPKLRLDAVEESVGFYESRGFVRGATNEGQCILERPVALSAGRRKTRRRKSRR